MATFDHGHMWFIIPFTVCLQYAFYAQWCDFCGTKRATPTRPFESIVYVLLMKMLIMHGVGMADNNPEDDCVNGCHVLQHQNMAGVTGGLYDVMSPYHIPETIET